MAALFVTSCFGGGGGTGGTDDERDVSGNYALTYDNRLTLRLDVGGATREVTQQGMGGIVDFGVINGQPVTLDLGAFCARSDVQCPSEAFWSAVAMTQPDLASSGLALQKLVVVDDSIHALDAGLRAASLTGLVDHADHDRFLLGLGASGAGSGVCVALSVSLAGGRVTREGEHLETSTVFRTPTGQACDAGVTDAGASSDAGSSDAGFSDGGVTCTAVQFTQLVAPRGAKPKGLGDGVIFVGYAGGCAFGSSLAAATLTLQTGFTGVRTGPYTPPPFTPAPVVLPDAGLPDGGRSEPVDAGP